MATAKPAMRIEAESGCARRTFKLGTEALEVELTATVNGLIKCDLQSGERRKAPHKTDPESWESKTATRHVEDGLRELEEFFQGKRSLFDVPLEPVGTDFQRKVWDACAQIPYSQTRSYWWIAVRLGNPHAMRAVGSALGANPLPLFIPCHRVVRQDGAMGGFTCGIEWKRLLLNLEAENLKL